MLQGAVPDVAYTNPSDGQEKIVELKFINQCPSRYGCDVATSLRTAVNKREQQLYQEYLTSVAINHRTQLPLLFISPLGFAPRFRPSVSIALGAPPDLQWVLPGLHIVISVS